MARSGTPGRRGDRGAVLVEYALVLAVLLVGSFGTIQFLDQRSRAEVDNQAECISTRPPPPGCQAQTATTLPPTSVPPTSATTTTPPPVLAGHLAFLNARIEDLPDGRWDAIVDAELNSDDGSGPVAYEGATVRVKVTITGPPNPTPFFIDCVTAPNGQCELRFTTPAPGVTDLVFDLEAVDGFAGSLTNDPPPIYTHP